MDCIELSIKKLDEVCCNFAHEIKKEYQPDMVIYLAKGAYLIGKSMSDVFGVPLIAVGSTRDGNELKEKLALLLGVLPRWLCNFLRRIELKSNVHGHKKERHIKFLDNVAFLNIQNSNLKILLVDDSVDTGSSILAAKKLIKSNFSNYVVRVAALNVMSQSRENVKVDYYLYTDKMLRTPMSKDSREYRKFLEMYSNKARE